MDYKIMNEEIARQLMEMAAMHAKSPYRKRAYTNAAKKIRSHTNPILSGKQASNEIYGIGESIAEKIDEIIQTGQIKMLAERSVGERNKSDVIKLFKTIHGVSDVTAEEWYNARARSLEDLAVLYNNKQMTDAQMLGFFYYNDFQLKIPRAEIDTLKLLLHKLLDPAQIIFEISGSYRRQLTESGDIDILVNTATKDNQLINMNSLITYLTQIGLIIGNFTPNATVKFMGVIRIPNNDQNKQNPARRLDIRLIDNKSWPFALLYFTGSKEFNIKMRNRALSMGLSLSEYNIVNQNGQIPENALNIKTEKDIFDLLKMKYLDPAERTDKVELVFTDVVVNPMQTPIEINKQTGKWYNPNPTLFIYISDIINIPPGLKKIAGFDLDGTLIQFKYGMKFSQNPDHLELMPNRIPILQQLINAGYIITIFTNQKSITNKKRELSIRRLIRAIELLNIPLVLFAAIGDDEYRKPNLGMWNNALTIFKDVDMNASFFCGDAAGRNVGLPDADFSDSDKKFAENIKLKFFVPEQIFKSGV